MHVRDGVDSDRLANHAVHENERETAHDATAYAERGSNVGERWTRGREIGDELHHPLDRRVETHATTGTFDLVAMCSGVELGTRLRSKLDRFHVRF